MTLIHPPLPKKGIIFISGEIEDDAYAQFRGGGEEGRGGGATRSVMGDVHKHIFHQHCSQMKAVKTA